LKFRVLLGVSVPTSLIVLSAVMNPDLLWDKSGAHLIPTKDVGDSLAWLRPRVAVRYVHAYHFLIVSFSSRGRGVRCSVVWDGGW